MHSQRRLIHEVDRVRSCRNVMVGEDRAASEFEIGRNAPVAFEVPLQSEWIEANAVCRVRRLKDEEDWNGIDGIFKTATEETRKVRVGEDPSVPQSGVERASVAAAAADRVSAACPDLDFVAAFFGSGLRQRHGR